ncbi:MAG: V-type ATPase 116kDa subunit family protein [Desulfurococcaceae archaeon]
MKKVRVLYPSEHKDKILMFLQEAGVVDIAQQEAGKLLSEYENLKKLHEDIMSILSRAKGITIKAELTGAEIASLTLEKIKSEVSSIQVTINSQDQEIYRLRRAVEELQLIDKALSKIPTTIDPKSLYYKGKRISSALVLSRHDSAELITKNQFVKAYEKYEVSEDQVALFIYLDSAGFNEFFNSIRSSCTWHPPGEALKLIKHESSIAELRARLQKELADLQTRLAQLEKDLEDNIKKSAWVLGKYLLYVENALQRYLALGAVQSLKHISMIVGWIPGEMAGNLISRVSSSGIPTFIELSEPEPNESPPTLMKNKPIVRFYQVITRLYGIPGYKEWDPTPLIAYSFAFFFALMNADVGYSLIGILAALFLLDRIVDNPESYAYREFKGVVLISNIIALIFGFLSGSIFGDLIQRFLGVNLPVILTPLSSPLEFIKLSMIVGLVHVNIAHILATIKFARERRTGELIIEAGLIIGEIFGIPYILSLFLKFNVPLLGALPESVLIAGSTIGVGLIVVGSLLTMRWLGLLMWIFQITGLLGDVLSYVRLAGVGLATYYMATIFNFMNEMIFDYFAGFSHFLGVIATIPLLVASNILILVLAQLGAFIHSLRLCVLEFLTKFYDGSGREYSPLRVVYKTTIVLK